MSESLVTTLKIILIVFDVLIILSIICYAFKGFRKGLIHTSLVLASRILPLLLILLFIKPIGKIIIHAHIPYDEEVLTEEVSISGIVKTEIANNYFDGNLDELIQTKLDLLIDDFLISMVGIVLYIVFAIFVFLILSSNKINFSFDTSFCQSQRTSSFKPYFRRMSWCLFLFHFICSFDIAGLWSIRNR